MIMLRLRVSDKIIPGTGKRFRQGTNLMYQFNPIGSVLIH